MLIRQIKIEDAEKLINLIKEVEATSDFMLMEPGERKTTPEQQSKQLERIAQQTNATILVAEKDDRLVGYMYVLGGNAQKTKHSAYIVIGILNDCRGQGVGTALFRHAEEWARSKHITRLELTAVTENAAGVALYKKSGFEIEGVKRNSLKINGNFVDEYYMSKLL